MESLQLALASKVMLSAEFFIIEVYTGAIAPRKITRVKKKTSGNSRGFGS
jgi:hypothetical protein